FYEARWFTSGAELPTATVSLDGADVPFGPRVLFEAADVEGLVVGVEVCEDLWGPVPPSSLQALGGATVLLNPSASNEVIGKAAYRRQEEQLRERCEEIFHTQVAGLAKRLEVCGATPLTIGVSGGLDSTLALLVACKTLDALQGPRSRLLAFTMPGFGTTSRTLGNA